MDTLAIVALYRKVDVNVYHYTKTISGEVLLTIIIFKYFMC